MFGKSKKDFLSKILQLPHGIPSHDTINRVFSLIRADKFEQQFTQWSQSLKDPGISKEVISVDGKTLHGSRDSYHGKSAIPELLKILDIEGCIVTIDAQGTQMKIASLL